jgi:hypothetical protein
MRNVLILAGFLGWVAVALVLCLTRCWAGAVPVLVLGFLVESVAHEAFGGRLDLEEDRS